MFSLHLKVSSLSTKGLSCTYVTGDQDDAVKEGVLRGAYQLVLFTPELLINEKFWRKMLLDDTYAHRLRSLVVDEAHTVKRW